MNSSADLLKELRIDRSTPPPASRRGLWMALAIAAAVLLVALSVGLVGRDRASRCGPRRRGDRQRRRRGSVLDATGYVVARRMATVSSKITGKVREVLIEEGQHVQAGQVLATLDPIDADAERDLAAAQLGRRAARPAACRRSCAKPKATPRALRHW